MKQAAIIALLTLASCAAHAQALTLDQLTRIEQLDPVERDAYLTTRGWSFDGTTKLEDSVFVATWKYKSPAGILISRLDAASGKKINRLIVYSTESRPAFDAIRAKITEYRMELTGSDSDALRTHYKGTRYNVTVGVEPATGYPKYRTGVQLSD